MSEKVKIEVTSPHLIALLWKVAASEDLVAVLKKERSSLPGFSLALAIVERESAENRVSMTGAIFREIAKAGYSSESAGTVHTRFVGMTPFIEITPPDLIDQMEE